MNIYLRWILEIFLAFWVLVVLAVYFKNMAPYIYAAVTRFFDLSGLSL